MNTDKSSNPKSAAKTSIQSKWHEPFFGLKILAVVMSLVASNKLFFVEYNRCTAKFFSFWHSVWYRVDLNEQYFSIMLITLICFNEEFQHKPFSAETFSHTSSTFCDHP